MLSLCKHKEVIWTHDEMVATYKPREEALEWNLLCPHLNLGFSSLYNCETWLKNIRVHSLQYIVNAGQANEHNY